MFVVMTTKNFEALRVVGTRKSEQAALRLASLSVQDSESAVLYNYTTNEFDFYYKEDGALVPY